jgi:glycosyltransferase involved in cell wall biosynthesis
MSNRVVMIGAFPPPVGGAAKNNQLIFESLKSQGVEVVKLDTAASSLSHRREVSFHAQRIRRNFAALLRARRDSGSTLYSVPDGGAGAWYTLSQLRAAGHKYRRIVLHHRSFNYIDNHSRPMALIAATYPRKTTHVFLSSGMADAFMARYGTVEHIVASNARFVDSEASMEPLPRPAGRLRIGHLSNLCRDKGFFEVARSFAAVRAAGIDAELHLAGPAVEPQVESCLASLREIHEDRVVHLGPLNGASKRDFYRGLDLFLFPTQFIHEASPNVVFEALAAGIPVLATSRGCIAEMIGDESGRVCPKEGDFPSFVRDYVAERDWDAAAHLSRARTIKNILRRECQLSLEQYGKLMQMLGAAPKADIAQEF